MRALKGGTRPALSSGGISENQVSSSTPARTSNPRRILIVDDHEDSLTSLAILLALVGHDVESATDGDQAIEVAERFRPEFVILDIGMPRLNGYETCKLDSRD